MTYRIKMDFTIIDHIQLSENIEAVFSPKTKIIGDSIPRYFF